MELYEKKCEIQISSAPDHSSLPLLESLENYSREDIACFDVPGHVRSKGVDVLNRYYGNNIMNMDINSSPYMDNVSNPSGVIKKAQDLLADAYCCNRAFFITNGTTQAIQAMIVSSINPGDKIIMPRNVHKSAINALIMCGGKPVYIQPEFDCDSGISLNVDADKVIDTVKKNRDAKAVFLLNPTYYGACTDLRRIVEFCHSMNIKVLVDEAHGAHFPFNRNLPISAMEAGADMSAVSIHKTGGSMTQSSALLINEGLIDFDYVQQVINMLQSTSASYILMGSIDGARYNLVNHGENQLKKAIYLSEYASECLNKIEGIKVIKGKDIKNNGMKYYDPTKLCINVKDLNISGTEVYNILYREFDVQAELGDLYNVLALVSIGTEKKDIDRLVKAMMEISIRFRRKEQTNNINIKKIKNIVKMTPREAFYSDKENINIEKSSGRICAESIMAYPPGIPILSPGEMITDEIIGYILELKDKKAYLTDMSDKDLKKIKVIK